MNDPFFTTEAEEMSRAFDPAHADTRQSPFANGPPVAMASDGAPQPAALAESASLGSLEAPAGAGAPPVPPLRRAVNHSSVCPFCGMVAQGSGSGGCGQCGMENTQATRAATRAKLGPWYVWQARNPAAPGMSFATLMALVHKGRITRRSVVRGPTTGQLWRYAARVKGLSREFGNCWHCGGELAKSARLCAACKRLQQPPMNPDMLLETSGASQVAARPQANETGQRGLLSLSAGDDKATGRGFRAEPERPAAEGFIAENFPAVNLSAAHLAAAHIAAADALTCALEALNTGDTALPMVNITADSHPVELRAFQLPGEDLSIAPLPRRGGGLFRKLVVAALLAFVLMSGGLYLNPEVRPWCIQWFNILMARLTGPDGRPVNAPGGDVDSSVTATHREPRGEAPKEPPQALSLAEPAGAAAYSKSPPPEIILGPGADHPAPPTPAPASIPAGVLRPDASIEISPPPTDPQALEQRATDLRDNAIGFERRGDWSAAIRQYELILQLHLPEGVGPTDTQARLEVARKLRGGERE